jgi:hypothetical protein
MIDERPPTVIDRWQGAVFIGALSLVVFVQLLEPGGGILYVNPDEVSSLRSPRDLNGHWVAGTKCVLVMTNGKFNALGEDCGTAHRKLAPITRFGPCVEVCGDSRR